MRLGWELVVARNLENHWLKVGKLWQGRSLSSLHSCIRNKLHLSVYIVTMAASTTVAEVVVATNHMALKHKICVWSLKKKSAQLFPLKCGLKYFLLCSCFSSSLCIKKSWRSGLLQDETPELRSPIKEKKRSGDSGFPADSSCSTQCQG